MNILFITCKVNNFRSKLLLKTVENPIHNRSISTVSYLCILSATVYKFIVPAIPNLPSPIFDTVANMVFNSYAYVFQHTFFVKKQYRARLLKAVRDTVAASNMSFYGVIRRFYRKG